jgi:hypothetical protein
MMSSGMLEPLQEPQGVTSQETPFFIVTAVKTSNLTQYFYLFCYFTKVRFCHVKNEMMGGYEKWGLFRCTSTSL